MNLQDTLPPSLSGAARMLHSAYPGGMPDTAYMPVLTLLYEHFSDRNLAELVAAVTGKDVARVFNDIQACASSKLEPAAIDTVKSLLERHGLQAVCADDE